MYDVIIIGAGISGLNFANKITKYAKTLIIEANEDFFLRTNIFPEHNRPYLESIKMEDKRLFPRNHIKTLYLGKETSGIINSEEFGEPLGKIVYTDLYQKEILKYYLDKGGEIKFGETVTEISKTSNQVEVYTDKKNSYKTRLLAIATGSRAFHLQQSLGFQKPDSYLGIYTHLFASEDKIKTNFDFDYMFHVNPNISKNGPFFFNVGKDRVCTGYLGNSGETVNDLVDKLERILKNYEYIQPNLKGLNWDKKNFITGEISKHPIDSFSKDRVIILGEAAGLVTAFFYEGILSGLISADIASDIIKSLLEAGTDFSEQDLITYDEELKRFLLNRYYKNGEACEYVFYGENSSQMKIIWETYTKVIKNNKKLRKQIWEAYRLYDLSKYDTGRDKWAGEQLFQALPALSKLTLGGKFLKALVKF